MPSIHQILTSITALVMTLSAQVGNLGQSINSNSQLAQAVQAPIFVQANSNRAWNSSSVSVNFTSNVTAGNIIAVSPRWGSSAVTLNSITANCVSGNFVLLDNPKVYNSTAVSAQGYAVVSNSGSCSVTANFSGPAGGWVSVFVHEISGVDTSNPLDGHTMNIQTGAGTAADALTSGNVTVTQSGDYIFGVIWDATSNGPTYSAGNGFVKRISADGVSTGGATEDKIFTGTGSVSATFTQSMSWANSITGIMAFKPAGGSTPPPPPPPTPTNGQCSNTLNTCISGTFSDITDTSTNYLWQCNGSNGGTTASCSLPIPPSPTPDTTAPSIPTGLSATAVSSSQINLSWNSSTDPSTGSGQVTSGVTGYDIYRNGSFLTSTSNTNYNNTGLSPSTSYSYTVRSKDAAGNTSAQSSSVSATTQAVVPPPPSNGDVIPTDRKIDWSQSGIPGSIPNRTTVCSNITAGATRTTIQNALNSCPANQVVLLAPGTYNINGSITIPSNVTLRGSGPQQTILSASGSGSGFLQFGANVSPSISNSTAINSGATIRSQSITVASASGITAGSYIMITQLNDPSYVTITTTNGSCTWCDGGIGWNGTRVQGQIVEVTSVNGNTVNFSPSLYIDYSRTPLATRVPSSAKYAGVEDLQVYMNNSGYTANFMMSGASYSWIKNVESNYTDGDHVQMHWGYRNEVRDSYFHDGFTHSPGSTESQIFIANKTSGSLIENNILRRLHVSIMFNWGAAGNVVAYNYTDGNFDSTGYNTLLGTISMHGAHPMFNLIEGNVTAKYDADYFWGSSSHNTAFRNWFLGATKINPPLSGRGAEQTSGGYWASQALAGVDLAQTVRYNNLIGNIIGSDWQKSLGMWTPQVVTPQNRSYYSTNNPYGYSFGYANLTDTGTNSGNTSLPYTTAIIHGDYDYVRGLFKWDATRSTTIPASLYLYSKPSWFGSLAWPAFGPDPGNSNAILTGTIPAKYCYEQGKMPNCFSTSSVPPSPPPPPTPKVGDFNNDGLVNSIDLSLMISSWNTSNSTYDLNRDGLVNSLDYTIMVQNWSL